MVVVTAFAETDPVVLASKGEEPSASVIFFAAEKFFRVVTTIPFKDRYGEEVEVGNAPWLIYTITRYLDVTGTIIQKGTRNSKCVQGAAAGNWTVAKHLAVAAEFADRQATELEEFAEGGKIPKSCALWTSLDCYRDHQVCNAAAQATIQWVQVWALAEQMLKRNKSPRKEGRAATAGKEAQKGNVDGDVMCTLSIGKPMPLPTIGNKAKVPCAPFHRHGICCKRSKCNKSHTPLEKLSPKSQRAWIQHLKTCDKVYLNSRRIEMSTDGEKFMRVAKAGADQNTPREAGAAITLEKK